MTNISFFVLILLGIAAAIVIISIVLYNKHLDKITRGEIHDTHSALPEPGTAASVIYKIVLMIVTLAMVFSISAVSSLLITLQSNMSQLRQSQERLSREVSELSRQITEQASLVRTCEWEFLNPDYATQTAQVRYSVVLKQYSDGTQVSLNLDGKEIKLAKEGTGTYGGTFEAGFFERYGQMLLCITEDGKTITEDTDFPEYVFWNYFPLPSIAGQFTSDYHSGKLTYGGSYSIDMEPIEEVEKVTLSYLTSGQVLKTMDVTQDVIKHEWTELEKGLKLEKDLTFKIEIETKTGFKIVDQSVMIYATEFNLENAEFLQIYDANGKLVWEDKERSRKIKHLFLTGRVYYNLIMNDCRGRIARSCKASRGMTRKQVVWKICL